MAGLAARSENARRIPGPSREATMTARCFRRTSNIPLPHAILGGVLD